jgi:hypothetical protein
LSVDHGAAAAGPRRPSQLAPSLLGIPPRSEICIWSHHASGQLAGGVRKLSLKANLRGCCSRCSRVPLAQDPQTHAELPILGQSSPHRKRQASAAALS